MDKRDKLRIVLGAIAILALSLILNAVLAISAFEETYRISLIDGYKILANDLKRDIEIAVDLEKPIERFKGMNALLEKILAQDSKLKRISVALPSGNAIYSTENNMLGQAVLATPVSFEYPVEQQSEVLKSGGEYTIALPIYYHSQQWVATVMVQFDKRVLDAKITTIIQYSIINGLLIFLATVILFVSLVFLLHYISKNLPLTLGKYQISVKSQYLSIIVTAILIGGLGYTYSNNAYFNKSYRELVANDINNVSSRIEHTVGGFLQKGIAITQLYKIEVFLKDIVDKMSSISDISITDDDGQIMYQASKGKVSSIYDDDFVPTWINLAAVHGQVVPLDGRTGMEGWLVLSRDDVAIDKRVQDLLIDLITVIVVSLIFSFEILLLFFLVLGQNKLHTQDDIQQQKNIDAFKIIRPIALLFYFADAIPLSFLPILIKKVSPDSFWGISGELLLSLPISAYMLGVGAFLPIVGYMMYKVPLRNLFILSTVLTIISFIACALNTSFLLLILFRFISGMGFGGMVISGQTFVVRHTGVNNRATGFSQLMAGFFAGNICAVAIGGLISSRLGYSAAFFTGVVIAGSAIILVLLLIKEEGVKGLARKYWWSTFRKKNNPAVELAQLEAGPETNLQAAEQTSHRVAFKDLLQVFKNRSFVAAILFESLPAQITYISFMFYMAPLYLNSIGVSVSSIGRALTGFGLAVIFLSPIVSKLADRLKNDRIFMIIGNIAVGSALTLAFFAEGLLLVVFIVTAIGVGTAMLATTESSFISLVEEAKTLGASNVISIFRTLERVGQILGPIIAGVLINLYQYSFAIGVIGIINLVGILLFVLFSKNLRVVEAS